VHDLLLQFLALARLGLNMQVDFYRHDLEPSAADAIARVIATPFLTSGAVGRDVEKQIAAYFGAKHALLVSSWTSGAIAALLALGVGPDDEVIVPAMTFIATANVAEILGARPVFVDVDPETMLLTPEAIARAITPRTKAVIPVHMYGQMMDVAAVRTAIRDRPDVAIIEDSAHCFEGQFAGQKPGAHSSAAIFSFYATKNITCGEGGAIITNDTDLYQRLMQTRMHGMSSGAVDRFKTGGYRHWDMERLGIKANLPDLLAALLPPQIATVDERLLKREQVALRYERAFANFPIRMPRTLANSKHARHLFVIHVPPTIRDDALMRLAKRKIGCTVNYRSVPTLSYYRTKYGYRPESFPVSYEWGSGTITLPLYPSLSRDAQDHVIDTIRNDVVPKIDRAWSVM
jgi:UDP-4-amino-4-deoxy-L-arabinose-oxoglutarate aminotransferase